MAALMTLMTRFCAGEDSWLARSNNTASNPGTSGTRDSNGKPRRNKQKRRKYGENAKETTVNAGFSGSKSGQRKGPLKNNNSGPSSLDRILDRQCQSMAPQERQPPIPTKNAGSSNKPAGQVPKTEKGGLKAMMAAKSLDHRTQEGKRNFPHILNR